MVKSLALPLLSYVLLVAHTPAKKVNKDFLVKIDTNLLVNFELEDDEIIVDGRYYDIIAKEKKGNGYLYTCVDDEKESNYISQIKEESKSEDASKKDQSFGKLSLDVFCENAADLLSHLLESKAVASEYKIGEFSDLNFRFFIPPRCI